MADDDGNEADPPANVDHEELKTAIREVLGELGLTGGGDPDPDPDPDPASDGPEFVTIKQAEEIARKTVADAMKVLRSAAPPKPTKPGPKREPEPPPEAPEQADIWAKVKKVLAG
jgi:hypothetical protein